MSFHSDLKSKEILKQSLLEKRIGVNLSLACKTYKLYSTMLEDINSREGRSNRTEIT